ncbi:hypothetical protein NRI_0818 [Neorickettsia risticii str. Illinois]|uniref:Uncharacterized protein n=1 Tax=Neorickettsia risticii (strain Illinois) TaxID=434131 RepID=C6V5W8_NEORI|nr:hypothetical protein NRI_0818 [Neorickettsia risticii str. Illinois]
MDLLTDFFAYVFVAMPKVDGCDTTCEVTVLLSIGVEEVYTFGSYYLYRKFP